jgi:putative spermidine/putrescine transport system substrate-binding protein
MAEGQLSRRALLGMGVAGSLTLLAGCSRKGALLAARRGDLPEGWLKRLPGDWRVRWLEGAARVQEACVAPLAQRPALAQLSDGWARALPLQTWDPFGHGPLLERLAPAAGPASRLFGEAAQPPLAFPWSVNPWVLVLRDRPDLARRAHLGWNLLLEASLTGKVVLPSSPRVVMALVGEDRTRLCQLRRQVLAHDDRNGIQLLLNGPAEAAVLPRQQVVPLLRRDPRLSAVLPEEGGPVAWSLLLRPAGTAPSPPEEWLEALLQPPLLARVLAAGWVPPLPRSALSAALEGFPPSLRGLLLPPEAVRSRWGDLPPLPPEEQRRLQELWNGSRDCQSPS